MPEIRLRGGALDGLSLNYLVEGRGPAIILVHGLGGFAESWRHNVPALAERATVYAVDLPGFGRSGKPPGRYDLQFLARALHAFVDALGVSQVSLVGHSLGGAVCVTYALTHPAFVERLALVGAIVPGVRFPFSWRYRLAAQPGLGEALALCAPDELTLLPWESERAVNLKEVLRPRLSGGFRGTVNVFIGPEGGFTPAEAEAAKKAGALTVSLGPWILRTETAGLFAASALVYELLEGDAA